MHFGLDFFFFSATGFQFTYLRRREPANTRCIYVDSTLGKRMPNDYLFNVENRPCKLSPLLRITRYGQLRSDFFRLHCRSRHDVSSNSFTFFSPPRRLIIPCRCARMFLFGFWRRIWSKNHNNKSSRYGVRNETTTEYRIGVQMTDEVPVRD